MALRILGRAAINLIWWPIWLHELCHYVPARLLGFGPVFYRDRVQIDFFNQGKTSKLVVMLAPAAVGVLVGWGWMWAITGIESPAYEILFWLAIVAQVGWQVACINDFYKSWLIIRGRL